jgi:hypothetical protein
MNIAANQAIYPQAATHLPYPNGAIIQNPLQQPASIVRKSFLFYQENIIMIFLRPPIRIWARPVRPNLP